MRLNLGCGEFPAEGWVNVDCHAGLNPDVVADLASLPFPDNSAEMVYAGHVFEHVDPDRLPAVLAEVRRVLAGPLMVVGPDLTRAEQGWPEVVDEIKAGAGRWPGDAHLWDCREDIMLGYLQDAGFTADPLPIAAVDGDWPVVSRVAWQFAIACR